MAHLSSRQILAFLETGDTASTMAERGKALEDLICYVFGKVPGVEVTKRNRQNAFGTEEIDVALWNNAPRNGLHFLPYVILIECKNWSHPVGSQEVSYFVARLRDRGTDFGILVAANGITGSDDLARAHYHIAMALKDGVRVIVVTRAEIEGLTDTAQLVRLCKEKLCELAVSGTVFLCESAR